MNAATVIVNQPTANAACLGGSSSFSVTATGQGSLTYQWRKNGVNISGNATATSSTLLLSGIVAGDAANYSVVVTGSCGSVTSSDAALTINTATAITTQPQPLTRCAGLDATFTVAAAGQGSLSYVWRKNGTSISGATNDTLILTNISSADAANYSVVVTGSCGSVTSNSVALSVSPATTITSQPTPLTLCTGSNANFSVTATGTGTLSYQWQLNGNNVGTNSNALAVNNVQAANAGTYTVVVTSATCGSTTSNGNAVLTVNPLTTVSQPQYTGGCINQSTVFSATVGGTAPYNYQWKLGGSNISGATSSTYTINNTTAANDGNYSVAVTGQCGAAVTSPVLTFTVTPNNTIALSSGAGTNNQQACLNVPINNITYTTTGATGIDISASNLPPGVTADWSNNTLTISGTPTTANTYNYSIPLTGGCGTFSATGTITVSPSPSFTVAPGAISCRNTNVTYTTQSGGQNYQWTIPGTSGTDYTIVSGGTSSDNTLVLQWKTFGSKTVTVNYSNGTCSGSVAASNTTMISLGGIVTVGTGGDFTTIASAVTALNTYGVCGPTELSLISTTYSVASALTINQINGSSATNTVTIKPASGINATISGSLSGTTAGAIFIFSGANYVTIDGSNNGTNSRNLTILNSTATATSAVVWLKSSTSAPAYSSANNTIKNCKISGTAVLAGIYSSGNTISTTLGNASGNNNNSYINNEFLGTPTYAITTQGSSSNYNTGTTINNNVINSGVKRGGILAGYERNITISGNNISGINSSLAFDVFGINCGYGASSGTVFANNTSSGNFVENATITNNVIGSISQTNTYSAMGIGLGQNAAGNSLIANNMISGVISNASNSDMVAGIALCAASGSTVKVYHNTVAMQGNVSTITSPATTTSSCLIVTTATTSNLDIRNNIFSNTQADGSSGMTYNGISLGYSNYSALTSDNNLIYVAGNGPGTYNTGVVGTISGANSLPALADWQSTTSKDAASAEVEPFFTSTSDLHLIPSSNPSLDNLGVPVSGVTTDIDSDVRSNTTPDIGADEFVAPVCNVVTAGSISATVPTFCVSGSTIITATGYSTGYNTKYRWQSSSDQAFTTPVDIGPVAPSPFYTNLNTGNISSTTYYRLKVTCQANASVAYSNVVVVTINPAPEVTVSSSSNNYCSPGGTALSITAGGANSYSWSPSTGLSDSTGAIVSASPLESTIYTVTGTDGNGCFATADITINSLTGVAITNAIATPNALCQTGNSSMFVSIDTPNPNDISYSWSPSTFLSDASVQNPSVNNISSTTDYTVIASNNTTGCSSQANITIVVSNGVQVLSEPGSSQTVCEGSPLELTVLAQGAALQYQWYKGTSPNGTAISSTLNPSAETPSLLIDNSSPIDAGNYYVTITSTQCGSSANSGGTNVTINSTPTADASTSNSSVCEGSTISLIGSSYPSNGVSYSWSGPNGYSISVQSPTITNASFSDEGTYTLTTSLNGCSSSSSVDIQINPTPSALSVTPSSSSICSNSPAQLLTASGGASQFSRQLGVNTTLTATSGITPYSSGSEGSRVQYLITNAELSALGIVAGDINSIAFKVLSQGSYPQSNFTIKMAQTLSSSLSGYANNLVGSFQTVYSSAQESAPAVGWKVYNFSTSFNWSGVYNIVVEICHDNDINNSCNNCYGQNSAVEFSQTSFSSVYGSYGNNSAVCGNIGDNLGASTYRPNMKFGIYSPTMVTWSPITGLYSDAGATQAYGGGVTSTVYAKPTVNTIYTASAGGCVASAQATVNISTVPGTPGTISGPTSLCGGATVTFSTSSMYDATLGYSWTVPAGMNITNGQGTTSITVSVTSSFTSGNITVASVNSCGTGAASSLAVTSSGTSAPATPSRITGSTNVCSAYTSPDQTSNNVLYSSATVSGATSYNWTAPANATIVQGQGTRNVLIRFNASFTSGNIEVRAANACGLQSAPRTLAVSKTAPVPGAITGATCVAAGTPITYSITAVSGATSYQWTLPSGATGSSNTTSIAVTFASNFSSGTVSVSAVSTCGTSTARSLTVKRTPDMPAAISGIANPCPSTTVNYSIASVFSASSYNWVTPTGSSGTSTTTAINVTFASGFSSGNLQVRAVNGSCVSAYKSLALTNCNIVRVATDEVKGGNNEAQLDEPSLKDIKALDMSAAVNVYPNPTQGNYTMEYTAAINTQLIIEVFDASGKLVSSEKLTANQGINKIDQQLGDVRNGLYLIRITDLQLNKSVNKTIVKQE